MEAKEQKILDLAPLIKKMRMANNMCISFIGGNYNKRKPNNFTVEDLNLILNNMDKYATIESLSIDLTYSEIKSVILEVREMDLVVFTDTVAERLKELKFEGQ